MNIKSDAIIINQCDRNEFNEFRYNGYNIKFLSFKERGIGLSRNNALMRATADICLLSDDDLVYYDNYVETILKSFENNPDADVIIFNLDENPPKRYIIEKKFNVSYINYMRFGAPRIAFKTKSITKCGISFNLHFGGGSDYGSGEDTIFLSHCLKNNLKIIAVPEYIATLLDTRDSTWFNGYTDKYFIDRGALFACISKRWAWILSLQFCLRHRNIFIKEKTCIEAYKLMLRGIREFKNFD